MCLCRQFQLGLANGDKNDLSGGFEDWNGGTKKLTLQEYLNFYILFTKWQYEKMVHWCFNCVTGQLLCTSCKY